MTKQSKYAAVAISFAFVWAGLAALAASAAPPSDSAKSTAKTKSTATMMSDTDFAKAAAEGGFAEVRFGELAEDKASNKTVKDLAQRMVDDHTKGGRQSENRRVEGQHLHPLSIECQGSGSVCPPLATFGDRIRPRLRARYGQGPRNRHRHVPPRSKRRQRRVDQELRRANPAHFGRSLEISAPGARERLAKNQREDGKKAILTSGAGTNSFHENSRN